MSRADFRGAGGIWRVAGGVAVAAALCGCVPAPGLRPPDEETVMATLTAAFAPAGRTGTARWAAGEVSGGVVRFRPVDDEELAALWRPGPYESLRVEGVNCRFYPVWRVTFRPAERGNPRRGAGPQLVAEIVASDALGFSPVRRGSDAAKDWMVLGRWWPARDAAPGWPDFRLRGRRAPSPGTGHFVTAWPTWAVPSRHDAGFMHVAVSETDPR